MPNLTPNNTFAPTPEMILAGQKVFTLMAHLDVVRNIVDTYKTAILKEASYEVALQFQKKSTSLLFTKPRTNL